MERRARAIRVGDGFRRESWRKGRQSRHVVETLRVLGCGVWGVGWWEDGGEEVVMVVAKI
jgi:hypothetical protein